KKALEGEDTAAMERASQHLTQASHKLAEVMYQQQAQGGAGGAGNPGAGGPGAGRPAGGSASDEVIDAEYVDVGEKK
ncbi:MAG TPA: molecular chaperone DnaK, partial [Thermoanaerobaculia bacterium]|nr:molecular chaperone DnaK [Thermoanaerobaculia bacterium]